MRKKKNMMQDMPKLTRLEQQDIRLLLNWVGFNKRYWLLPIEHLPLVPKRYVLHILRKECAAHSDIDMIALHKKLGGRIKWKR